MYRIILLDYRIPQINGIFIAVEIKKMFGSLGEAYTPFLCCCVGYTELQSEDMEDRASLPGIDHVFIKPVRTNELDLVMPILS